MMGRNNTLNMMVKIEFTKCANWSAFEHSSPFPSTSKSHNLIILSPN